MPSWQNDIPPEMLTLMWTGDMDKLYELYPCQCCCDEHTHAHCEARHYNGCRSGLPYGVLIPSEDAHESP